MGVFKFLPYYQDEIVQHRPGIVQMGGEGKQDLASQQSALLRNSALDLNSKAPRSGHSASSKQQRKQV